MPHLFALTNFHFHRVVAAKRNLFLTAGLTAARVLVEAIDTQKALKMEPLLHLLPTQPTTIWTWQIHESHIPPMFIYISVEAQVYFVVQVELLSSKFQKTLFFFF